MFVGEDISKEASSIKLNRLSLWSSLKVIGIAFQAVQIRIMVAGYKQTCPKALL